MKNTELRLFYLRYKKTSRVIIFIQQKVFDSILVGEDDKPVQTETNPAKDITVLLLSISSIALYSQRTEQSAPLIQNQTLDAELVHSILHMNVYVTFIIMLNDHRTNDHLTVVFQEVSLHKSCTRILSIT